MLIADQLTIRCNNLFYKIETIMQHSERLAGQKSDVPGQKFDSIILTQNKIERVRNAY